NPVKNIVLAQKGTSTLSALSVWFDKSVNRLNTEERGFLLGAFSGDDKIIAYYKDGYYKITGFDIATHFDDNMLWIEKYNPTKPITIIYRDNLKKKYFIKRTLPELSSRRVDLTDKEQKQELKLLSVNYLPQIEITSYVDKKKKEKQSVLLSAADFVEVMKPKARGKSLGMEHIIDFKEAEPLPYTEPEEMQEEEPAKEQQDDASSASDTNTIWDEEEKDPGVQMTLFDE
ncbi:MAG: hypothetical protein LBQ64_00665, partial [Bacteroidales bacterium]|nr:hypothetical protein [Bacteroidales bacterium]